MGATALKRGMNALISECHVAIGNRSSDMEEVAEIGGSRTI